MAAKAKEIEQRYQKLVTKRASWMAQWRELAIYIFPRRISSLEVRTAGSRQTERLFDSTAIFANEVLSAAIQSGITNQSLKWFSLALRDEDLNADSDVALWLEDSADKMLLAFRQSNLAAELHELYLDLGAFGIGAMLIEPDAEKGLLFRAIPIGEYVIDENAKGHVDTIYYEFKMSLRAAAQRFGESRLPDEMQKKLVKQPYEDVTLIHAVYPRHESERSKLGRRRHPFASCIITKEKPTLLSEGGYEEFPFVVPRWTKASGEIYGRSPGHTALPDVKTLNKAIELELRAWAKVIDPPMKARRNSIIGDVDLAPGSLVVMRDTDDLKELTTNPRFDIGQLKKEEQRQSINNIFFVDQMLQLMARDRPQMTATEVQVKVQLLQQVLGPTFGRLEAELLNPLLDRAFAIMMRRSQFGTVPGELRGLNLDIQYEGPLARAQRSQQLLAIERTLTLLSSLISLDQEVVDNFDIDLMAREGAEISGVPKTIMRSPEAVAERRALRRQKQETEAELMRMQNTAEAAGKVAPLVKAIGDVAQSREGATPAAIPPIA